MDYIRSVAPYTLPFHVPNGGLRTKSEAAKLEMDWEHSPAFPIYALVHPRRPRIAFIGGSSKCPAVGVIFRKSRKTSAIKLVIGMGVDYGVAHSIDDVQLSALALARADARGGGRMSVYYNEIDAYCAQWLRNLAQQRTDTRW